MSLSRREFIQLLAAAGYAGLHLPGIDLLTPQALAKTPSDLYEVPRFGNVSLLHFTDCHAQLTPIWFREPSINIGVDIMNGRPPHFVGKEFLKYHKIEPDGILSHALTYLDFVEASKQYGKVGGFAHLATLVKKLRAQRPGALLLDGGDTWQGSATSLWTAGQDMVDACKLLGVDVMTAHWEFMYGADRVSEIVDKHLKGHMSFLAQNVIDNEWGEENVFDPYVIREVNGVPVAIIGQAFPYTPIANPRHLIPKWSMGIREESLQGHVNKVRAKGAQVVVLLSHNGMDVDWKLASRVSGIDVILGGHTHDGVPQAFPVKNSGGQTLLINSGSNTKFLSVVDLDVRDGKIKGHQFKLLPIFSNLLEADKDMAAYIDKVRKPFQKQLDEPLAVTGELLFRRGNFNGSFDQVILDALMKVRDTEIAFSPGFRWGTSKLPGETVTMEDLMTQTAITYPTTTVNEMTGETIKLILEDVADNLFNKDPYYQQGGDMVRVGGMTYSIDPNQDIGKRISNMQLNGKPIDANKVYKVAGWASVQEDVPDGPAIWDVVAKYMRDQKTIKIKEVNQPKILNMPNNPGMA